ncbi:MAG: hypothetical protein IKY94_09770 [Lachnospiraceae bacterium]|nr:hypothetical protein [Lachnospiraceae bacterium]
MSNSKGYKKTTGIKFNLQEVRDAIAPGAIGTFIKAKKKKKEVDLEEIYGIKPERKVYESTDFKL